MELYLVAIILMLFAIYLKLNTMIRYFDLLAMCMASGSRFESNYKMVHQKFFISKKQRKKAERLKREEEIVKNEN